MKPLLAVLWKDLRLFFGATGFIALLLPLVLLLALQAGAGDLMREAYVEPFPIAVRDEDQTVMSRSLTNQMEEVALFSQVLRAEPGQSDTSLLEEGAAAVVTIPKDFFYDMYTMENGAVKVLLNEEMPLEARLLRSVFLSVIQIIRADQSVGRAVFTFCYGPLDQEQERELWHQTSVQLLQDALGRQQVFDQAVQATDYAAASGRSLFACALSLLCLFFPLTAVRSLSEERTLGVLPRYVAAGGRAWTFFASKFLAALLLTIPACAALLALFRPAGGLLVILTALLLFAGAFGVLLGLTAWAREGMAAQRWGNLYLLFSLVAGGALYPLELLPPAVQRLSRLTLPYYARRGVELAYAGGDVGALMGALWPVLAFGAVGAALALPALRRPVTRSAPAAPIPQSSSQTEPAAARPGLGALLALTTLKTRAMSGGWLRLTALLITCALCGTVAAQALSGSGPSQLSVAAVRLEESDAAQELLQRLEELEGVAVIRCATVQEGRSALSEGRAEGLLTIGSGYAAALETGDHLPLSYESAASAASAQAVREIIAGQASVQQARSRGLREAAERLGRPLTAEEQSALLAQMDTEDQLLPPLYTVETASGAPLPADPMAPNALGCGALVVLFTLFTWGAWTGRVDARRVEMRLRSLPGALLLSYGSDALSLCLIGLLAGAVCLLPGGWPALLEWGALLCYVPCVAGLTLALTRCSLSGRMDVLAPFLALITCLVGGCFGSLEQFSPLLRTLSRLTPQGLALAGGRGRAGCLFLLLLAAALFLFLGRPSAHSTTRG